MNDRMNRRGFLGIAQEVAESTQDKRLQTLAEIMIEGIYKLRNKEILASDGGEPTLDQFAQEVGQVVIFAVNDAWQQDNPEK